MDLGFPTRAGGGLAAPSRGGMFPAALYPADSDFRLGRWPIDPNEWTSYIGARQRLAEVAVDFRGGLTKGFAYCYSDASPPKKHLMKDLAGKRSVARIDGEHVHSTRRDFSTPFWIFERDEYAFRLTRISLESTRGDV